MCGLLLCTCAPDLPAQTSKSPWQEAIKLVDSPAEADIAAAVAMLQPAIAATNNASTDPLAVTRPPVAELTLAALSIRQGELNVARNALATYLRSSTTGTSSGQSSSRAQGQALRMQLYLALSTADKASAEEAFKDLVRLVVGGTSEALDARATAQAIAATIAMVEMDRPEPRIAERTLNIGTRCLMESTLRGVASTYETAYAQANERAVMIGNFLSRIDKEGIEVLESEYEARRSALAIRQAELANQKELTSEVIRNSREQIDQNTLDLRQLNREISSLVQQLRQPTPGHPGPKRPAPPPPPPRSTIVVPEFESFNDFDYIVRDGETIRVPVIRTQRRSQVDIDSERDRLYSQLLSVYNAQMVQFRTYEATYDAEFKTWAQHDRQRRQELSEKKAEAEAKRDLLTRANKDIQQEKRDSTKQLRLQRTAEEQEEFELQILQIALAAAHSGEPQSAFRPSAFEFFNWTHEKTLLQRQ